MKTAKLIVVMIVPIFLFSYVSSYSQSKKIDVKQQFAMAEKVGELIDSGKFKTIKITSSHELFRADEVKIISGELLFVKQRDRELIFSLRHLINLQMEGDLLWLFFN